MRVTRAALRAFGQLVASVRERLAEDSDAARSFAEGLASIVGAARFWKLAHNESPLVCSALRFATIPYYLQLWSLL